MKIAAVVTVVRRLTLWLSMSEPGIALKKTSLRANEQDLALAYCKCNRLPLLREYVERVINTHLRFYLKHLIVLVYILYVHTHLYQNHLAYMFSHVYSLCSGV